jgi:hypothetical protein
MNMRSVATPSQPARLGILVVEFSVLLGANFLAFGDWIPDLTTKGLWFYVALFGLLFGKRLDTPFYAKPVDVVLYAAPTLLALLQASTAGWVEWSAGERIALGTAMAFSALTAACAAVAIWTKDSSSPVLKGLSESLRILTEMLGAPRVFFSVILFCCVFAFNRDSAFWILVAWALTVAFSPLDWALFIVKRIRALLLVTTIPDAVGTVAAYQTPGVVLLRENPGRTISPGQVFVINDPQRRVTAALGVDYVGRDEGVLLRAIDLSAQLDGVVLGTAAAALGPAQAGVFAQALGPSADVLNRIRTELQSLVGIVARETSAETLRFEVTAAVDLEEGRIVESNIGNHRVAYQVVNGLTKEEVVQQKSSHGFIEARAQKLGTWDAAKHCFRTAKWLPQLNSPVFLKPVAIPAGSPETIGRFPKSDYTVYVRDIHQLVTHNAAVLGILGVGKSMLAIELVERMIAAGIKVICLDLTNQYGKELAAFWDPAAEENCIETIRQAGEKDRAKWAEDPERGGSLPALTAAIHTDLASFFMAEDPRMLKVYNPSQLVASKQLHEPKTFQTAGKWNRRAALWSVTPVEVTRIVSEAALTLLQGEMVDRARVCLVYEEAHSLVPEWNSVASDGDREAANGTARAIMQGRKFGLGCLVVSQRTANVTKTILNQCNTVFAMRTFDATGKDFLSNYIGEQYAEALSLLPDRHAVVFGRALSSETPVLIELNDRQAFVESFRKAHPPPNRVSEPKGGGGGDDEKPVRQAIAE